MSKRLLSVALVAAFLFGVVSPLVGLPFWPTFTVVVVVGFVATYVLELRAGKRN
jgi:hypothetical protein